jgi:hypothetical protein
MCETSSIGSWRPTCGSPCHPLDERRAPESTAKVPEPASFLRCAGIIGGPDRRGTPFITIAGVTGAALRQRSA